MIDDLISLLDLNPDFPQDEIGLRNDVDDLAQTIQVLLADGLFRGDDAPTVDVIADWIATGLVDAINGRMA